MFDFKTPIVKTVGVFFIKPIPFFHKICYNKRYSKLERNASFE